MYISDKDKDQIIKELAIELNAKPDGGMNNLIAPVCPFCGKGGGKFGVYIGEDTGRRKTFMSHCFKCGKSTSTLGQLLEKIHRMDLMPEPIGVLRMDNVDFTLDGKENELDDMLYEIDMPEWYRRTYDNRYLNSRGFTKKDYGFFEVGTTRGLNYKYDNYVIFPIVDNGVKVGHVSRHVWGKQAIDDYNEKAKRENKWRILRYKNSVENDFSKLLYNYDAIVKGKTTTVVLTEGVFDVIALCRKLHWYDNDMITAVATFGKKISDVQIYKLQEKGVRQVILGYDGDAVEAIKKVGYGLTDYFDVYVADILEPDWDWDSMDFWDIYDVFAYGLRTFMDYSLKKVQLLKL